MKIFAISDLHLSLFKPKSMDIFGEHWQDHWEKIQKDWRKKVTAADIVLLPGDLSWAMTLEEAKPDIAAICAMPGKKILMRGNHDFWWGSLNKVNSLLNDTAFALQNNAYAFGDVVIAGTRGWLCPNERNFSEEDEKIYRREIHRLKLSLNAARKKDGKKPIIVMMHYPPFNEDLDPSGFTELFNEYGVVKVIYGHLHAHSLNKAFEGNMGGVTYILVSCDHLNFQLKHIY